MKIQCRANKYDGSGKVTGSYINHGLCADNMIHEHTIAFKGCYPERIGIDSLEIKIGDSLWVSAEFAEQGIMQKQGRVKFYEAKLQRINRR